MEDLEERMGEIIMWAVICLVAIVLLKTFFEQQRVPFTGEGQVLNGRRPTPTTPVNPTGKNHAVFPDSNDKRVAEPDSSASINAVLFNCAAVDALRLPYNAVIQQIRDYLQEAAVEEPGTAACLMLVSLNTNQTPGGVFSSESIQLCKETLTRYVDNILENPADEKYRKIRIENRIFAKSILQEGCMPFEGAELFLKACGFVRRRLSTAAAEREEEFFVLEGPVDYACRSNLESLREALATAQPIVPELDRDVRLLRSTGRRTAEMFNRPDEFSYSVTSENVKSNYNQLKRDLEENLELRTKNLREGGRKRKPRKLYRFTVIRIRFPMLASSNEHIVTSREEGDQQLILQGTFYAEEKLEQVVTFVAESLSAEWQTQEWWLWDPSTRKPIDAVARKNWCLYNVGLVPSAVLVFKPLSVPLPAIAEALFRAELLEKIMDL